MRRKLALLFASITILGLASLAYAKSIEDTFGGKIILTTKSIPSKLNSAADVNKLNETKFSYEKQDVVSLNYIIFLKKPISSSGEVTVYDITDGLPGSITMTTPFYTSERDQRIFLSNFDIDEKSVPGNRKYQIVFSYKGTKMAKGEFYVKAKPQKFDGKVEFTDEETKGK